MKALQGQLEGQQIGRYLIRQRLGGGGVATVYQAYDQVAGQSVALKVLPPNPDAATLDRFRREALMAGALRHPHIVRILQVGTAGNGSSAYIAMDLVQGESLAALLARFGQLRAEESCALLEPVARALAFAHSHGVVHRDVKPSNILLRPVSLRPDQHAPATAVQLDALQHPVVPLLSDFGIARFLDAPELTNVGRTVGTPAFMAPEQCMGSREVDGRADIYSLGTVLYRCVTGRLPFNGSTTQILHAHVFEPVVIEDEVAATLPPKVVEILRRALAKAPEDRYQEAEGLATDLALVAAGEHDSGAEVTATMAAPSTMTMTLEMAQATEIKPPSTSSVQVLVPGAPGAAREVAAAKSPAVTRPRGPSLDRMLWALFFVVLIGGGGYWSARSWLQARAPRTTGSFSLPAVKLTTFTPTPASDEPPGGVAATSTPGEVVALATVPATTGVAAATQTAPSVPTDVATPTLIPTPIPSSTPTPIPTALPVAAATATQLPPASTPVEPVAGICTTVVDPFLLATVQGLVGPSQLEFACPTKPASVAMGEWMPFSQGTMVAIVGEPLVYVVYGDGTWEQVLPNEESLPPNAPTEGRDDRPVLPPLFARILAAQGRHLLLGEPLQSEPIRADTIVQPFGGGVILGNKSNGQILLLGRNELRF